MNINTLVEKELESQSAILKAKVYVLEPVDNKKNIDLVLLHSKEHLKSNHLVNMYVKKVCKDELRINDIVWVDTVEKLENYKVTQTNRLVKSSESQIEKNIFKIWELILETSNFDNEDVFFEIGGDSLKCVQVLFHLNKEYPNVTLADLFTFTTIKDLALYLENFDDSSHSTVPNVQAQKF